MKSPKLLPASPFVNCFVVVAFESPDVSRPPSTLSKSKSERSGIEIPWLGSKLPSHSDGMCPLPPATSKTVKSPMGRISEPTSDGSGMLLTSVMMSAMA